MSKLLFLGLDVYEHQAAESLKADPARRFVNCLAAHQPVFFSS